VGRTLKGVSFTERRVPCQENRLLHDLAVGVAAATRSASGTNEKD